MCKFRNKNLEFFAIILEFFNKIFRFFDKSLKYPKKIWEFLNRKTLDAIKIQIFCTHLELCLLSVR